MRTSDDNPSTTARPIAPPLRLSWEGGDRQRTSRLAEIWRRLRGASKRRRSAERAVRQAQRRVDQLWRRMGGDS